MSGEVNGEGLRLNFVQVEIPPRTIDAKAAESKNLDH